MIFLSFFTVVSLKKIFELLVMKVIPLSLIVKLFLLSLPYYLHLILPMSVLLACLLGFSKMSSQFEVLALKTSGLSLFSMFFPVCLFACAVSMVSFVLQETVVPWSVATFDTLYTKLSEQPVNTKGNTIFLKTFLEDGRTPRRFFYAEEFDLKTKVLTNVTDIEFNEGVIAEIVSAESAHWLGSSWEFQDGKVHRFSKKGQPEQVITFKSHVLRLLETPGDILARQKNPEDLTIKELYQQIRFLKRVQSESAPNKERQLFDPVLGYQVYLHWRFSLPLTAVLFAIIGTAMGITTKPYGSFFGIGVAALIIFPYYYLSQYMMQMGKAGYVSPAVSIWLPYGIFTLAGIGLMIRRAG